MRVNRASDTAPSATTKREAGIIFVYISLLGVLLSLGTFSNVSDNSNLAYYPLFFYLKNELKLDAAQVSWFLLLLGLPTYIGFVFGLLRDRWNPGGQGDRGYLLMIAPLVGCAYLLMARFGVSYFALLALSLTGAILGAILGAAYNGLTAVLAQRAMMTGRLGALISAAIYVPAIVSALAGGWLSENVPASTTFTICALLMFAVGSLGMWRPVAVFGRHNLARVRTIDESVPVAVWRLLSHRPFIPAAILMGLWQIMPGWGTPLVFHLTNTLKLSETQVGVVQAYYPFCMAAAGLAYVPLCGRFRLGPLLWVSMILGIIVAPSALLMHDYSSAIAIQILVGVVWGVGNAALYDLMLRSYPEGLHGTGAMVMAGIYSGAYMFSDWWGSWIFERGGFGTAMLITTITSLCMLPVLLWIPKNIMASRDGESHDPKPVAYPAPAGAG
jgi:predicted MFS family arabinose efflux permease